MNWMDDDLHLRVVGEQGSYFYGSQGPVVAAPVVLDDDIVAYVWAGEDPRENAAGIEFELSGEYPNEGGSFWSDRLKNDFQRGVPSLAAIEGLLGQSGPGRAGTVGHQLRSVNSKRVLRDELNPHRRTGETRRSSQRQPQRSNARTSDVDAVLRGFTRSTPEILEQIERIDESLRIRPTSEPTLVSMQRARGDLPGSPRPGLAVHEPTFLRTTLFSRQAAPAQSAGFRVVLRVPAGVPALFIDPADGGGPIGTLLLARGLTWVVQNVSEDETPTLVTGLILAP